VIKDEGVDSIGHCSPPRRAVGVNTPRSLGIFPLRIPVEFTTEQL